MPSSKCLALPSAVQISACCTMAMAHMPMGGQGVPWNPRRVGEAKARQKTLFYGSKRCYSQAEAWQLWEALPQCILASDGAALLRAIRSWCSTEIRNLHSKHTIKSNMEACWGLARKNKALCQSETCTTWQKLSLGDLGIQKIHDKNKN